MNPPWHTPAAWHFTGICCPLPVCRLISEEQAAVVHAECGIALGGGARSNLSLQPWLTLPREKQIKSRRNHTAPAFSRSWPEWSQPSPPPTLVFYSFWLEWRKAPIALPTGTRTAVQPGQSAHAARSVCFLSARLCAGPRSSCTRAAACTSPPAGPPSPSPAPATPSALSRRACQPHPTSMLV